MIRSDGYGRLSTSTVETKHTTWPCVPGGHEPTVSCDDAIEAWAARQGRPLITEKNREPRG